MKATIIKFPTRPKRSENGGDGKGVVVEMDKSRTINARIRESINHFEVAR